MARNASRLFVVEPNAGLRGHSTWQAPGSQNGKPSVLLAGLLDVPSARSLGTAALSSWVPAACRACPRPPTLRLLASGHMVWQGEVFLQLYCPAGPHLLGIICTTCRPSSLRQLLAVGRGARATILPGGASWRRGPPIPRVVAPCWNTWILVQPCCGEAAVWLAS